MYGSYNFWSWFRYWYLDTANQVAMMLIDKPFYDYDYEPIKTKTRLLYEDTVLDESKTRSVLAMFGIGTSQKESLEELQELAMTEMNEHKSKN